MADATARDIDSTLIIELGTEERGGIHLVAIRECAAVQITVDGGTDGVVGHHLTGREQEIAGLAMSRLRQV